MIRARPLAQADDAGAEPHDELGPGAEGLVLCGIAEASARHLLEVIYAPLSALDEELGRGRSINLL